jgi:hypothetical protein
VHAGADVIVVDGMQGGTAATQTVFIEHVGIPTLAALRQAVNALDDLNMRGKVTTIARACGKQDVHHLEKEDLVALTVEAAAMAECRWRARRGFPALYRAS